MGTLSGNAVLLSGPQLSPSCDSQREGSHCCHSLPFPSGTQRTPRLRLQRRGAKGELPEEQKQLHHSRASPIPRVFSLPQRLLGSHSIPALLPPNPSWRTRSTHSTPKQHSKPKYSSLEPAWSSRFGHPTGPLQLPSCHFFGRTPSQKVSTPGSLSGEAEGVFSLNFSFSLWNNTSCTNPGVVLHMECCSSLLPGGLNMDLPQDRAGGALPHPVGRHWAPWVPF